MRWWPALCGVLGVVLAGIVQPTRAEEPTPLDLAQAKTVMQEMDGDSRLQAVFALCPADAYERDAPFYAADVKPDATPLGQCSAAPEACYRRCMDHAEPGECFGLARAFQVHGPAVERRYAQMMFAMACNTGMGAGCTNRAASLRNATVKGDTERFGHAKAREPCEHRSFVVACTQGDAWGCAMLGQSYENGEGVALSITQARLYYERSCSIDPDFASCAFATGKLAEIGSDR